MEVDPNDFKLIEPESPERLIPGSPWTPWLPIGIGVVIVVILLALLLRKRMRSKPPMANRHAEAFAAAMQALNQCAPSSARAAATEASWITRQYLAAVAKDPALFETHEEFVSRHDSLSTLSDASRAHTEEVFSRLAALKYAPVDSSSEPITVVDDAKSLLESINQELTT